MVAAFGIFLLCAGEAQAQGGKKLNIADAGTKFLADALETVDDDQAVLEEILDEIGAKDPLVADDVKVMGDIEKLLLHLQAGTPFVTRDDKLAIAALITRLQGELVTASREQKDDLRLKIRCVIALNERVKGFSVYRYKATAPSGPPRR